MYMSLIYLTEEEHGSRPEIGPVGSKSLGVWELLDHRRISKVTYRVPPGFVVPEEVLRNPRKYKPDLARAYQKITEGIGQKGIIWTRSDFTVDAPGLFHSEPTLFVPGDENNIDRLISGLEKVIASFLENEETAKRFASATGAPSVMNCLVNVGVDCYENPALRHLREPGETMGFYEVFRACEEERSFEEKIGAGVFTFYASRRKSADNLRIEAALGLGTYITDKEEHGIFVCVLDPTTLEHVYSIEWGGFDIGKAEDYVQRCMHVLNSDCLIEEVDAKKSLFEILPPEFNRTVFSHTICGFDHKNDLPSLDIGTLVQELGPQGIELELAMTFPGRWSPDGIETTLWAYQLNRYCLERPDESFGFSEVDANRVIAEVGAVSKSGIKYDGPAFYLESDISHNKVRKFCDKHKIERTAVIATEASRIKRVPEQVCGIVMVGTTNYGKWKGHDKAYVDKLVETGLIDFAVSLGDKEPPEVYSTQEKLIIETAGSRARILRPS